MHQIYRRTPMPKCNFNKFALQRYWDYTSAWVFSYKFAELFKNNFPKNTSGRLLLDWRMMLFFVNQENIA